MNNELKKVVADAKRWMEQEQVWDNQLYASTKPMKKVQQPPLPPPSAKGNIRAILQKSSRSPQEKTAALKALYETYKDCTRCPLGNSRLKFVFGVGDPATEVLFVGEGPGYEEDHRGEP